jgi:galactokinase/mevalonate kinase-like predicted kinase
LLDTNELSPEALIAGLNWLVERDYLAEHGSVQGGYTLTLKGFAAMQTVK